MPKPLQAISYVRFSTPEQAAGASLDRQSDLSRKYCDKHGLILSEQLHDLGVSAFKGKNRQQGALGRLLALVDEGRIKRGTRLLVESIDRISRQETTDALRLLLDLIHKGIVIVTLDDEQEYDREALNTGKAFMLLAVAQRAHEESATKSKRVRDAWRRKRANVTDGRPLTKRCPAWLRVADDGSEFIVDKGAVETVRRIFEMCIQGIGTRSITKTLNSEGVAPIGRADSWYPSYVRKILTNRAVLGEFQPHIGTTGNRRPTGEVIENYYPAIVDRTTFHRANKAMSSRQQRPPGRTGQWVGLFSGLLFDALGSPWVQIKKHQRQYISDKGRRGVRGHEYGSIPADTFETLMLLLLRATWSPERAVSTNPSAIEEAEANLMDIKSRLQAVQDGIISGDPATVTTLVAMVPELEERRAHAETDVERLQAESVGADVELLPSLAEQYMADPADRETRLRLRQNIREHVSRVVITRRKHLACEPMKDPDTGRWIKRHAGQWVDIEVERVDGDHQAGRLFLPLRDGTPAVRFPLVSGEYDMGGWAALAATRRITYQLDGNGATFTLHGEPVSMPPLKPIVTVIDVEDAPHIYINSPANDEGDVDEVLASDGLRRGRSRTQIGDKMYAYKVLGRKGERIEGDRVRQAFKQSCFKVQ